MVDGIGFDNGGDGVEKEEAIGAAEALNLGGQGGGGERAGGDDGDAIEGGVIERG